MADAAPKGATYADLEAVSPLLVAEIIHGALVTHPRPSPRHAVAANGLGGEITSGYQHGRGGPGGWVFMVEPELHLGSNVVVPDIAGWRREQLPTLPKNAYLETPPDWVCEVLAPDTEAFVRITKRPLYAQAGIESLWLLNPDELYLVTFQLAGESWRWQDFICRADEVKIPPFDAAPFSLGVLWPFDEPIDTSKPPA